MVLRKLVDAGLLTKHERGRGRPTTYRLAEPAVQLVPVLVTLGAWGARHRPTTPNCAEAPKNSKPAARSTGKSSWPSYANATR